VNIQENNIQINIYTLSRLKASINGLQETEVEIP